MASTEITPTPRSVIVGIARELRPHQWYKQLILFIPLVYSGQATIPESGISVCIGAVVFSMTAGCMYILNDIHDREQDRKHPVKRSRPIASGQVDVATAGASAVVGFLVSGVIALWLDPLFLGVLSTYLVMNILYTWVLQHVFLIDIFVVGAGFVLRAMAGVTVIAAPLSPWLFLSVFLAALLLASAKRHAELLSMEEDERRGSLRKYTPEFSKFLLFLAASTLLMVYSLYTFFARQTEMMLTIPFAFYSVLRFSQLALVEPTERIHALVSRPDMVGNFILWGLTTLVILYLIPLT